MNQYPRSVCFADDAIDALVLLLLAHSPSEDLDSESKQTAEEHRLILRFRCEPQARAGLFRLGSGL